MIANLVSFFIATRFQRQSVYDILAMQDGIHLPSAEARREQSSRQVRRAMRPVKETLLADLTVQQAIDQMRSSEVQSWPVVDQRGVIGVISKLMLNGYLAENQGDRPLADLVNPVEFPHVHQDQSLELALNRMGAAGLDILPVVSRADVHKLEGVIAIRDLLDSYGVSKLGPI
jgi:CIC family chloride channel protein